MNPSSRKDELNPLFKQYIQDAMEQKYRPGYPELAYNILKRGETISKVKAQLGATDEALKKWALEYPEFKVAMELGIEAGKATLAEMGLESMDKQYFQSRVWEKIVGMMSPSDDAGGIGGQQITVTFEGI